MTLMKLLLSIYRLHSFKAIIDAFYSASQVRIRLLIDLASGKSRLHGDDAGSRDVRHLGEPLSRHKPGHDLLDICAE
jgi:hypothetical protein